MLPLALNQNTLGGRIDEKAVAACRTYGHPLPPKIKSSFEKEKLQVDGRNACAFLTTKIMSELLQKNEVRHHL